MYKKILFYCLVHLNNTKQLNVYYVYKIQKIKNIFL